MIQYRKGYKYQLGEDYKLFVKWLLDREVEGRFISVVNDGDLVIHKGYAWDGASGPVPDTRWNMRASLVHDALYQLIRNKHLPVTVRNDADLLFRQICIEDGVPRPIAWTYYQALKRFGKRAATKPREVLRAPR